ncbi:extracellular catalytic domain type 1 short-chain-length polyhydroxyalkanoate depolymerase [Pseudorhodoplanes sp.]|uniref:extracellular catalytic domain type 1 short-chain-length polyhydroxyalkanoate depolymerase n=1 Tax=Pseudorhodoplanes sp. TaxID=1934341 RepID=UPI003D0BB4B7
MKPLDRAAMLEAARLTQMGRLTEATALLQQSLGGTALNATAPFQPIFGSELSNAKSDTSATRSSLSKLGLQALHCKAKLPGLEGRIIQPADIAPAAGSYLAGTFSNEAGDRSFKLYVPSYRDTARPLIVMLHGCKQSADDFAAGTRMNFAAEKRGCFVVYPEQPQAANASKCWNWFRPGDQIRDRGEPSLIAGIVRRAMKDHDIDPTRVYVAGLSAGGAAAAIMGEAYPELFAAVGVHSGLACGSAHDLPSAFSAMRGQTAAAAVNRSGATIMPTIVFHGDRDPTVHPSNGTKVVARANGGARLHIKTSLSATPNGGTCSKSVYRDAEGRSVIELWEVHGAGHAWSGGSPAGSFTDQGGPDATEEMLSFFLRHRR